MKPQDDLDFPFSVRVSTNKKPELDQALERFHHLMANQGLHRSAVYGYVKRRTKKNSTKGQA